MNTIDEETQRLIRLQPRAAALGWAIAKRPHERTYRLVLYANPAHTIQDESGKACKLGLDEVEQLLANMDTPPHESARRSRR